MAKYLEGEEITAEELKRGIRKATNRGKNDSGALRIFLQEQGRAAAAGCIVDICLAPTDIPSIKGVIPGTETEEFRHSSDEEPFSALAFKIVTDPFVGKLCFFRVYSGTLEAGSYVYNATKGKKNGSAASCRCMQITEKRFPASMPETLRLRSD